MSSRRRDIDAAEKKLWRHVTRNVTPYHSLNKTEIESEPSSTSERASQTRPSSSANKNTPKSTSHVMPITLGATANIDRRTSMKFKRGKLSIDGQIDLHGLTLRQAHDAFNDFVRRSYTRQDRCILVITGKGRGGEKFGKIRRELPHWINESSLRSYVLAVSEAQIRDGGSGAFYILLKRKRPDS